jgi:hypothetical protein
MKLLTLALTAVVFLLVSDGQAQVLRGGSGAAGRGGFAAPAPSWGTPVGQPSQGTTVVTPQQPGLSQQVAQPLIHMAPGRLGVTHTAPSRTAVVPPVLASRWIAPIIPPIPPHWRRDRFFRHRHGDVVFVGWPAYGYVDSSTVITEVAPGVIREERRYQDSPANAPGRESGQLAPFDPTPKEVVERMLTLAEIKRAMLFTISVLVMAGCSSPLPKNTVFAASASRSMPGWSSWRAKTRGEKAWKSWSKFASGIFFQPI